MSDILVTGMFSIGFIIYNQKEMITDMLNSYTLSAISYLFASINFISEGPEIQTAEQKQKSEVLLSAKLDV